MLKLKQTGAGVMVGWGWGGQSAFLDLLEIEVAGGRALLAEQPKTFVGWRG